MFTMNAASEAVPDLRARLQIHMSPPPAPPPKAARAGRARARERQRREAPVEQEVDRIIDSQDNEYVLSRPKCAPPRPARGRHHERPTPQTGVTRHILAVSWLLCYINCVRAVELEDRRR